MTILERLPILATLLSLTSFVGLGHASQLGGASDDPPLKVVNASACNQQHINFVVDPVTKVVYLVDATTGRLLELTEGYMAIGFGKTLETVNLHFKRMPLAAFELGIEDFSKFEGFAWHLASDGIVDYTLTRPVDDYMVDVFVPDPLRPTGRPPTVPDLVIEPQTGCPPDDMTTLE